MVDALEQLSILTGDTELLPVRKIEVQTIGDETIRTRGGYFLYEEELPDLLKSLLHGRAFVVDKDLITEVGSSSPKTYYISADAANGLIVPGRSMCINADGDLTYVSGNAYYRWTDDGEHWTRWVTLPIGRAYSYSPLEKTRFAEVQVYSDIGGIRISLIVTR